MKKWKGYLATFEECEAETEEEAEKLIAAKMAEALQKGDAGLVVWLETE